MMENHPSQMGWVPSVEGGGVGKRSQVELLLERLGGLEQELAEVRDAVGELAAWTNSQVIGLDGKIEGVASVVAKGSGSRGKVKPRREVVEDEDGEDECRVKAEKEKAMEVDDDE